MKKADVKIGATYAAKVSNVLAPVTLLREREQYAYAGRVRTVWVGRNERTGREVTVKSAQRLRFEVELVNGKWRRRA